MYKDLASNEILKSHLDKHFDDKSKELSQDELLKLFLDFVEKNKRVTIHLEKIDGIPLGAWYRHKKSHIKTTDDEYYIKLSINSIVQADMDKLFTTRQNDKTFEEKLKILFEYVDEYKKTPTANTKYKNISLGSWFFSISKNIRSSNDEFYKILSINEHVKQHIDAIINRRKKYPFVIQQEEKFALLIEFIEQFKRIPLVTEIYKDIDIGGWFKNTKSKITSTDDILYKQLSTNLLIKNNIDTYLEKRKIPKK